MPYLEVTKSNIDEVENVEQVETPDVTQKTISEADKLLKESGLELVIEDGADGLDYSNMIVKEQIPRPGITVNKGSKVYVKF